MEQRVSGPSFTPLSPDEPLALRIVALDHYMARPGAMDVCWSEFEGQGVDQVPVVRIFGSTPAGQKACLHLHKAREGGDQP